MPMGSARQGDSRGIVRMSRGGVTIPTRRIRRLAWQGGPGRTGFQHVFAVTPAEAILSVEGLGSRMLMEIGCVEAIYRYPVKSMGGERLEAANLGWHGLEGDRRLALRRIEERSGFPWLTATKLPELLLFRPQRREDGDPGNIPTHIRMPDGRGTPVFGEELAAEVGRRWGAPVEMMQLRHGI